MDFFSGKIFDFRTENPFLASQDALEVMLFTYSLTDLLMVSIDLTDVTQVSDDT